MNDHDRASELIELIDNHEADTTPAQSLYLERAMRFQESGGCFGSDHVRRLERIYHELEKRLERLHPWA